MTLRVLRRKSSWAFVLAILVGLIFGLTLIGWGIRSASAHPSSVVFEASASATSTLAFMTPGTATTTFQLDSNVFNSGKVLNMQAIDSGSMFIEMLASSSVGNLSTLQWQFQFSNNGVDWYGESSQVAASNLVSTPTQSESTTTIFHQWTPGTTATTTKFIPSIPVGPAAHERIVFSIPGNPQSTASSSAFYVEVNLKSNPSTP